MPNQSTIVQYFLSEIDTSNFSSQQAYYCHTFCADFYHEINYLLGTKESLDTENTKKIATSRIVRYEKRYQTLGEAGLFQDAMERSMDPGKSYQPSDISPLTDLIISVAQAAANFYKNKLQLLTDEEITLVAMQGVDRVLEYMTSLNEEGFNRIWSAKMVFQGLALGDPRRWVLSLSTDTSFYTIESFETWQSFLQTLNDTSLETLSLAGVTEEASDTAHMEKGHFLNMLVYRYQDDFYQTMAHDYTLSIHHPSSLPSLHNPSENLGAPKPLPGYRSLRLMDMLAESWHMNEADLDELTFSSFSSNEPSENTEERKKALRNLHAKVMLFGHMMPTETGEGQSLEKTLLEGLKRLGYTSEFIQNALLTLSSQLLARHLQYAPTLSHEAWQERINQRDIKDSLLNRAILKEIARYAEVNILVISNDNEPLVIRRPHVNVTLVLSQEKYQGFYTCERYPNHPLLERIEAYVASAPAEVDNPISENMEYSILSGISLPSLDLAPDTKTPEWLAEMKRRYHRMVFRDPRHLRPTLPLLFDEPDFMAPRSQVAYALLQANQRQNLQETTQQFLNSNHTAWLIKGNEQLHSHELFHALRESVENSMQQQESHYAWVILFVPLAELENAFAWNRTQPFLPQYLLWRAGYDPVSVHYLKNSYRFLFIIEGLENCPIPGLVERFYYGEETSDWSLSKTIFIADSTWQLSPRKNAFPIVTSTLTDFNQKEIIQQLSERWEIALHTGEIGDAPVYQNFLEEHLTLLPLLQDEMPTHQLLTYEPRDHYVISPALLPIIGDLIPALQKTPEALWPKTRYGLYQAWCHQAFGKEYNTYYPAIEAIATNLFKANRSFMEQPWHPDNTIHNWSFLSGRIVQKNDGTSIIHYAFTQAYWRDFFIAEALWHELQQLGEINLQTSLWNQQYLTRYFPGVLTFLIERLNTSETAQLDWALLKRRWLDNTALIGREKAFDNVAALVDSLKAHVTQAPSPGMFFNPKARLLAEHIPLRPTRLSRLIEQLPSVHHIFKEKLLGGLSHSAGISVGAPDRLQNPISGRRYMWINSLDKQLGHYALKIGQTAVTVGQLETLYSLIPSTQTVSCEILQEVPPLSLTQKHQQKVYVYYNDTTRQVECRITHTSPLTNQVEWKNEPTALLTLLQEKRPSSEFTQIIIHIQHNQALTSEEKAYLLKRLMKHGDIRTNAPYQQTQLALVCELTEQQWQHQVKLEYIHALERFLLADDAGQAPNLTLLKSRFNKINEIIFPLREKAIHTYQQSIQDQGFYYDKQGQYQSITTQDKKREKAIEHYIGSIDRWAQSIQKNIQKDLKSATAHREQTEIVIFVCKKWRDRFEAEQEILSQTPEIIKQKILKLADNLLASPLEGEHLMKRFLWLVDAFEETKTTLDYRPTEKLRLTEQSKALNVEYLATWFQETYRQNKYGDLIERLNPHLEKCNEAAFSKLWLEEDTTSTSWVEWKNKWNDIPLRKKKSILIDVKEGNATNVATTLANLWCLNDEDMEELSQKIKQRFKQAEFDVVEQLFGYQFFPMKDLIDNPEPGICYLRVENGQLFYKTHLSRNIEWEITYHHCIQGNDNLALYEWFEGLQHIDSQDFDTLLEKITPFRDILLNVLSQRRHTVLFLPYASWSTLHPWEKITFAEKLLLCIYGNMSDSSKNNIPLSLMDVIKEYPMLFVCPSREYVTHWLRFGLAVDACVNANDATLLYRALTALNNMEKLHLDRKLLSPHEIVIETQEIIKKIRYLVNAGALVSCNVADKNALMLAEQHYAEAEHDELTQRWKEIYSALNAVHGWFELKNGEDAVEHTMHALLLMNSLYKEKRHGSNYVERLRIYLGQLVWIQSIQDSRHSLTQRLPNLLGLLQWDLFDLLPNLALIRDMAQREPSILLTGTYPAKIIKELDNLVSRLNGGLSPSQAVILPQNKSINPTFGRFFSRNDSKTRDWGWGSSGTQQELSRLKVNARKFEKEAKLAQEEKEKEVRRANIAENKFTKTEQQRIAAEKIAHEEKNTRLTVEKKLADALFKLGELKSTDISQNPSSDSRGSDENSMPFDMEEEAESAPKPVGERFRVSTNFTDYKPIAQDSEKEEAHNSIVQSL